jgi:hypothetical protein
VYLAMKAVNTLALGMVHRVDCLYLPLKAFSFVSVGVVKTRLESHTLNFYFKQLSMCLFWDK